MPGIEMSEFNWLAIAVAAFATFMLGGAWYSALFRKPWLEAQRLTQEQMDLAMRRPQSVFFGLMIVSYFVLAVVIAAIFSALDVNTLQAGAFVGFLLWIAAAAIQLTGHLPSIRAWPSYFIDMLYQLIYLVGMGAIIGGWR